MQTPTETIVLDVNGMKCAGCVNAVERQLLTVTGVKSARVNLLTGVAAVETESPPASGDELARILTQKGFPTQPRPGGNRSHADLEAKYQAEARHLTTQLAIAGSLLILSAIGHFSQPTTHLHHDPSSLHGNFWWHGLLATLALLFPGRSIILDGARSFWHGIPNMNTLTGMGAVCSYLASIVALLLPEWGWECFFEEPVMIIGFILLGRTLEQQAKHKAARSTFGLLSLQPTTARAIPAPHLGAVGIEIPADVVKVGEYLSVLPGEKIPADGVVRAGETTIDESLITGESVPVSKQPEDRVMAGSINRTGAIAIEVTRVGEDTALSQILKLVETAQTRKAPLQSLADRVAGYFTYGVLTIAALTFLGWYLVGQFGGIHDFNPTLMPVKTAIAVLTIACPCALGLATPTAILVGTGIGARSGLLFKGGDVLDSLSHVKTIAFDKTGTLTLGQPQVTAVRTIAGIDRSELLQLTAAAESTTNHPLARSIQAANPLPALAVTSATSIAGAGVTAQLTDDRSISVGNLQWLEQSGIDLGELSSLDDDDATTKVYVAIDRRLVGVIALEDRIREDAVAAINQLKQQGIEVILISGDRQSIVDRIAAQVGIERVYAEVLPAQKAQIIQQLQQSTPNKAIVAMVGDGINDAPALAQADIGVAMNTGTDLALDVAELILMRDRLADISKAIDLARSTCRKIKQNLVWAAIYNCLGIPAAAGIFFYFGWGEPLSPATAGAFMALSSVSVVVNSLLLDAID
jgi:P-type Cu2+ transporter